MGELQHDDSDESGGDTSPVTGPSPSGRRQAVSARAEDWASDRMLDPGDTHDKGEPSLCVGEAA